MTKINTMKTFNPEDLLMLLSDCSKHLMDAYQELDNPDLWIIAERAAFACDYLNYRISKESHSYALH